MRNVQLYLSPPHPCPYLDNREAQMLIADPADPEPRLLYDALSAQGFRRSSQMIYRPHCNACQACVPLRVPVSSFQPRRRHRRIWREGMEQFRITRQPATLEQSHYQLFQTYLQARHTDGSMSAMSEEEYTGMLQSDWSETELLLVHHKEQLVAVAITDTLSHGLSAVYTYFDPAFRKLSPGTFCLLAQIDWCQERGLPWLYLGYWIADCRKMAYKAEFLPHEQWRENRWVRVESKA